MIPPRDDGISGAIFREIQYDRDSLFVVKSCSFLCVAYGLARALIESGLKYLGSPSSSASSGYDKYYESRNVQEKFRNFEKLQVSTLCSLVAHFVDDICKQFGSRYGPTFCGALSEIQIV